MKQLITSLYHLPNVMIICALPTLAKLFVKFTLSKYACLNTHDKKRFNCSLKLKFQKSIFWLGLTPGDRWGLCAGRWFEAFRAGFAPPVYLEATNEAALRIVPLNILERFADTVSTSNGVNGTLNARDELWIFWYISRIKNIQKRPSYGGGALPLNQMKKYLRMLCYEVSKIIIMI